MLGAAVVFLLLVESVCAQPVQPDAKQRATTTAQQIETLLAQKAQRTPAQRKLSSQLLDMVGSRQPQASEGGAHRRDSDKPTLAKLVTVDIRADVTPALLAHIRALGGTVINSVPKYRAIRAQLPLNALERLAALDAVRTIRPRRRGRDPQEQPGQSWGDGCALTRDAGGWGRWWRSCSCSCSWPGPSGRSRAATSQRRSGGQFRRCWPRRRNGHRPNGS